jgi:hypothetical protein
LNKEKTDERNNKKRWEENFGRDSGKKKMWEENLRK